MKKANKLSIAEIKAALCGKRYHYFSGWNSMFRTFIITSIHHHKKSRDKYYILVGVAKSNPDFKYTKTVTSDCIRGLIDNGQYTSLNEVDHCHFRDTHAIYNH